MDYISYLRSKVGNAPIILNASLAIIEKNGKVLVQKRSDFNEWALPGGMMELGESAEETLRREVLEETGLTITIEYFQAVYTKLPISRYPNGDLADVKLFVFVCKTDGEPREDGIETTESKWIDPWDSSVWTRHQQILKDFSEGKRGEIK